MRTMPVDRDSLSGPFLDAVGFWVVIPQGPPYGIDTQENVVANVEIQADEDLSRRGARVHRVKVSLYRVAQSCFRIHERVTTFASDKKCLNGTLSSF